MAYTKPWKSHEDQLRLLTSRGLGVTDRAKALEYLQRIGYYRLSGYWYPFRQRSEAGDILDTFKDGATFEDAVRLYVFDKKLRLLVMDALERVEIALRVDISHTLGELDPFAYEKPAFFHRKFTQANTAPDGKSRHEQWLDRHSRLIERSKEEFILHIKETYGLPLAIWVACEIWDFGILSHLYSGMRAEDQDRISARYGIRNGRVFASWVHSISYLRNICAHHSRLWNRNIVRQPKLPKENSDMRWIGHFKGGERHQTRCFLLFYILRHLLRTVNPSSSWNRRLKEHILAFPPLEHLGLSPHGMGAPEGWEKEWAE